MRGYILVLVAATLWSSVGVFYKLLITNYGLGPLAVATLRASVGGALLLIVLVLLGVDLRVPRRDWPGLLAYGTFGVALFFVCYVNAVNLTGVAVAAVLTYTSPAWVAAISWRWMGERLGRRAVGALLLALLGAALVAQVYNPALLRVNLLGVLAGLAAGLAYGLYSVFNKLLVRRNQPWVVQAYGFLIGAMILLVLTPLLELARGWATPASIALLVGMAVIPTVLASLAFAVGVHGIPVSVAAIIATFEPFVATFFGYVFFGERLELGQWVGMVCILGAILLLRPRTVCQNSSSSLPEQGGCFDNTRSDRSLGQ